MAGDVQIAVRLPKELVQLLDEHVGEDCERSRSSVIREALRRGLTASPPSPTNRGSSEEIVPPVRGCLLGLGSALIGPKEERVFQEAASSTLILRSFAVETGQTGLCTVEAATCGGVPLLAGEKSAPLELLSAACRPPMVLCTGQKLALRIKNNSETESCRVAIGVDADKLDPGLLSEIHLKWLSRRAALSGPMQEDLQWYTLQTLQSEAISVPPGRTREEAICAEDRFYLVRGARLVPNERKPFLAVERLIVSGLPYDVLPTGRLLQVPVLYPGSSAIVQVRSVAGSSAEPTRVELAVEDHTELMWAAIRAAAMNPSGDFNPWAPGAKMPVYTSERPRDEPQE